MEINRLFITEVSEDATVWLEQIDNFGDDKHHESLNNLDVTVWALIDRKRDQLSYYHGKKRAAVNIGDCYQEAVTDLLTEVLISHGIPKDLIACNIDGSDTKYLIDGNASLTTERLDLLIKTAKPLVSSVKVNNVQCIYSNDIYMDKQ